MSTHLSIFNKHADSAPCSKAMIPHPSCSVSCSLVPPIPWMYVALGQVQSYHRNLNELKWTQANTHLGFTAWSFDRKLAWMLGGARGGSQERKWVLHPFVKAMAWNGYQMQNSDFIFWISHCHVQERFCSSHEAVLCNSISFTFPKEWQTLEPPSLAVWVFCGPECLVSSALFFNDSKNTEQKTTTRSFSGALKQVPLILVSQNCYRSFFRCGHQKEDQQTERSQKFRLHCVKKQSFCIALFPDWFYI